MPLQIMATGHPPLPAFFKILRIVIIVFSVILLGLSAWAINLFTHPKIIFKRDTINVPGYGDVNYDPNAFGAVDTSSVSLGDFGGYGDYHGDSGPAFLLVMSLWNIFAAVAPIVLDIIMPKFIFRLAVVVSYTLDIFLLLIAWALTASDASKMHLLGSSGMPTYYKNLYASWSASAGIGALLWILLLVHTALYVRACLSHPDGLNSTGEPHATQLQASPSKVEAGYGAQPVYGGQPQVSGYGAQPGYGAHPGSDGNPISYPS